MKIDDLRLLINTHLDKEEYRDALETCTMLAAEHASEMTSDDVFKKGLCHLRLDEDAEAVKCFNKFLEEEPDNLMALTNMGTCLYNMGKTEEAFKVFSRVIKQNKSAFPPWYFISLHYMKIFSATGSQEAMEKMVNALRQVVALAPDVGGFPLHDPIKDVDYRIETFLAVHSDIREMTAEELTTL